MNSLHERYNYLIKKCGNFWGMYLFGIYNIYNIKGFLSKIIIVTIIQFVSSYFINQIIINEKLIVLSELFILIMIFGTCQIIKSGMTFIFDDMIAIEKLKITERICSFADMLYTNSSYTWKSKNTNHAQKESLGNLCFAYENMTYMLSDTIYLSVETIVMITITIITDIFIGMYIIMGSILLYILRKKLNTKLIEYDINMSDNINNIKILISNQYVNRADIVFSPLYSKLFVPEQIKPTIGYIAESTIWNNREVINKKTMAIMDILKTYQSSLIEI